MLKRGSAITILTNDHFYLQHRLAPDTWAHTIIGPVARWMTRSFGGRTRLTEDALQNTKGGEVSLAHFNYHFPWITTNLPTLPLDKIQNGKWLTYLSAVIVVRLGIKTDKWRQPQNLTVGEQQTWNHLKQFAWNSEQAVTCSVQHYREVHGF